MDKKNIEEDIVINPITSGYVDRGMAKWQGLILSEHNETVQKDNEKNRKVNIEKEKQSAEEIYRLIDYSYSQKTIVAIQLDCLFNGKYQDDIIGVVFGYYENSIYIKSIESELVVCELELIRNITEYSITKWFKV